MADLRQIIIVDDEPEIGRIVAEYLGRYGFRVRVALGGPALDDLLASEPADLLILDVNMPDEDGFAIARRLRATDVRILMLTAANDVVDRVVGLELGADDYVTKPFDLRELRARVTAILRRGSASSSGEKTTLPAEIGAPSSKHVVFFGRALLDLNTHSLTLSDGTTQPLTTMEYDLLAAFARHPNQVLSRDRLLDLAHHREAEPFDRSIDIRIARIRRKVESDPKKPEVIKTIHGSGYMFVRSAR